MARTRRTFTSGVGLAGDVVVSLGSSGDSLTAPGFVAGVLRTFLTSGTVMLAGEGALGCDTSCTVGSSGYSLETLTTPGLVAGARLTLTSEASWEMEGVSSLEVEDLSAPGLGLEWGSSMADDTETIPGMLAGVVRRGLIS